MFTPAQIEALALRMRLELVVERGLIKMDIESDTFQIVSAVMDSSVNRSPLGPIIEDIKFLLTLVAEASVAHIRRQANSIAHLWLVKPSTLEETTWFDEPPLIISDLLLQDISLPCTN